MRLKAIRSSFHARVLNFRNVNNILHSDDFAIAYGNATRQERHEIERAIDRADKATIVHFVKKKLLTLTPFHQMSVRQLREIGRNVRLPKYWEKDKTTLIEEIEDVVKRLKEGSERVSVQPEQADEGPAYPSGCGKPGLLDSEGNGESSETPGVG